MKKAYSTLDLPVVNDPVQYIPWHFVWIEIFISVSFPKQLHPEDGKDIDDNYKEEGQVAKSTQSGNNDTQEYFHCGP